jgi:hypothetical protein
MADETEPKPSEDAAPADVVEKPTPVAYTTDVVSVGAEKDRDDDDESGVDEEPSDASRLSPFAVAAFVVSLLALYQAPRDVFTAQGLSASVFWRYILPTMFVPLGASIASLYLAMRASEEVFVGRLGGVGFLHAARVISMLVLLVCIAAAVLVLFFSEAPVPQQQFG